MGSIRRPRSDIEGSLWEPFAGRGNYPSSLERDQSPAAGQIAEGPYKGPFSDRGRLTHTLG
jgi:hypothetical protein